MAGGGNHNDAGLNVKHMQPTGALDSAPDIEQGGSNVTIEPTMQPVSTMHPISISEAYKALTNKSGL